MTPEQKRIEIAKGCGWTFSHVAKMNGVSWEVFRNGDRVGSVWCNTLPDYPNDLNAMREAELSLIPKGNLISVYTLHLWEITGGQQTTGFLWAKDNNEGMLHDVYSLLMASCSQRADAFLKTIGKL